MSYYTKITKAGLAAITAAMNKNSKVPISYMAFGDGNGSIPEPDENSTSLVHEVYRTGVNKVEVHNKNPNWLVCEAIIPSAVGGFNIREVALYDSTGNTMLAIASYPPTYKPTIQEGAAKIQTIRIVIQVDNSGNFELIVDPDVVLATVEYVNAKLIDEEIQTQFGRTQRSKNKDIVSILDFGAKGDGITDDLVSFQLASIYIRDYKRALHIPKGTYAISGDFTPYSGAYIFGDGKKETVIKLIDGNQYHSPMRIDNVSNVTIKGMTLDCNYQNRTGVPEGDFNYGGTSLLIKSSNDILIEDVFATNPFRHCVDITGSSYSTSNGNPNVWAERPSYNVWLNRVEASRGRDDNITTHQCHNIWITNCYSYDPLGGYVDNNNNCLEIDDGSRNIYVTNFIGVGGYSGVQVKGHANAAAPYNIYMTNVMCINNYIGFECRHTSFYGSADGGYSSTAKNLTVDGLTIIAPAISNNWNYVGTLSEGCALQIRSYDNVRMDNVNIMLNGGDLANDYLPAVPMNVAPVRIRNGSRNVMINSIHCEGASWSLASAGFIYVSGADTKNIIINDLTAKDVGISAFYATNVTHRVTLNNAQITNNGAILQGLAIYNASVGGQVLGNIAVTGYSDKVFVSANSAKFDVRNFPKLIGEGYQDNTTNIGYTRLNSNVSQDFGSSLRISTLGNLTLFFNGSQVGASIDANGGITSLGDIKFTSDAAYNIGSPSNRANTIYAATGAINSSDERLKQQFRSQTEAEKAAALEIKQAILLYKFNDAVEIKGTAARWHVGVSAQQIVSIMQSHGLNPFDYGFVCYDEWNAQDEIINEWGDEFDNEGNLSRESGYEIVQQHIEAGSRYAIRYDELAMFILSAI